MVCNIYTSNSTIISNAFKVCTLGKKYQTLINIIYITEGPIEVTLELGDNITTFYMFLASRLSTKRIYFTCKATPQSNNLGFL